MGSGKGAAHPQGMKCALSPFSVDDGARRLLPQAKSLEEFFEQ